MLRPLPRVAKAAMLVLAMGGLLFWHPIDSLLRIIADSDEEALQGLLDLSLLSINPLVALGIASALIAISTGRGTPTTRLALSAMPMMLAAFFAFFVLKDGFAMVAYQYDLSQAALPPLILSVRSSILLGMIGSLIGFLLTIKPSWKS